MQIVVKVFFVLKTHGQVWLELYTMIIKDSLRHIYNHFQVDFLRLIKKHLNFLINNLNSLKGYYFTGDGALTDKDGHFQITGRVDDVINVSGHRVGTAEIEDILVCKH